MSGNREVLECWVGSGARMWFGGDHAVDSAVRERFSAEVAGKAWEESPEGAVARVVVRPLPARNACYNRADTVAEQIYGAAISRRSSADGRCLRVYV